MASKGFLAYFAVRTLRWSGDLELLMIWSLGARSAGSLLMALRIRLTVSGFLISSLMADILRVRRDREVLVDPGREVGVVWMDCFLADCAGGVEG